MQMPTNPYKSFASSQISQVPTNSCEFPMNPHESPQIIVNPHKSHKFPRILMNLHWSSLIPTNAHESLQIHANLRNTHVSWQILTNCHESWQIHTNPCQSLQILMDACNIHGGVSLTRQYFSPACNEMEGWATFWYYHGMENRVIGWKYFSILDRWMEGDIPMFKVERN